MKLGSRRSVVRLRDRQFLRVSWIVEAFGERRYWESSERRRGLRLDPETARAFSLGARSVNAEISRGGVGCSRDRLCIDRATWAPRAPHKFEFGDFPAVWEPQVRRDQEATTTRSCGADRGEGATKRSVNLGPPRRGRVFFGHPCPLVGRMKFRDLPSIRALAPARVLENRQTRTKTHRRRTKDAGGDRQETR